MKIHKQWELDDDNNAHVHTYTLHAVYYISLYIKWIIRLAKKGKVLAYSVDLVDEATNNMMNKSSLSG